MIESQVTSLELSKRLNELGIDKKSVFVWEYVNDQCYAVKFIPYAVVPSPLNDVLIYSAFTVAELLELLPHRITLKEGEPFNSFRFKMEKSFYVEQEDLSKKLIHLESIYITNYECDTINPNSYFPPLRLLSHNKSDENPANALAKMLIYLLELKLIPVVNEVMTMHHGDISQQ